MATLKWELKKISQWCTLLYSTLASHIVFCYEQESICLSWCGISSNSRIYPLFSIKWKQWWLNNGYNWIINAYSSHCSHSSNNIERLKKIATAEGKKSTPLAFLKIRSALGIVTTLAFTGNQHTKINGERSGSQQANYCPILYNSNKLRL